MILEGEGLERGEEGPLLPFPFVGSLCSQSHCRSSLGSWGSLLGPVVFRSVGGDALTLRRCVDCGSGRSQSHMTSAHSHTTAAHVPTCPVSALRSVCSHTSGIFFACLAPSPNPEHLGVQGMTKSALDPQNLAQSLGHGARSADICRMHGGLSCPQPVSLRSGEGTVGETLPQSPSPSWAPQPCSPHLETG